MYYRPPGITINSFPKNQIIKRLIEREEKNDMNLSDISTINVGIWKEFGINIKNEEY